MSARLLKPVGDGAARAALRTAAFSLLLVGTAALAAPDPYADAVRGFTPGPGAGFGADLLPHVVLGPPHGTGTAEGSLDVVSLGHGGVIELVFRDNLVFDGPGDDLVVFENAFHAGSAMGPIFDELAWVELSEDGEHFVRCPWDPQTGQGLAGQTPVFSNPDNGIDPLAPEAGGDRFDLASCGLDFVRYVRLIDGGDELPDLGNLTFPGSKGGFDLDAVAALNSVRPGRIRGQVLLRGQPAAGVRVKLFHEGSDRRRRRRTRDDGGFRFRRLVPAGVYSLRAKVAGEGLDDVEVELSPQDSRVRVHLWIGEAP
jgi:hypothetical protein